MFIFLFLFVMFFPLTLGMLIVGRHVLSFWISIVIWIVLLLSIIFFFAVVAVCIYNYLLYDISLLLLFDAQWVSVYFVCSPVYLLILILINIVFCMILFYAFYYMYFDVVLHRFFSIFWWFVVSMNYFILSGDFLCAYIGWELLGLFSFFLISYFWYRFFALKYASKAFFISKIGDIFFIVAYTTMNIMSGYSVINFSTITCFYDDYVVILYVLSALVVCSCTKSTQFGLHIWLPDAMEGPIPVSALIHAATLVVCGIILVSFIYTVYDVWFNYYYFLLTWSSVILLFMCCSVFYNFDVKRFIAFSTICQISFAMFCCLSIDMYVGILFFCYHMYYKATLFIIVGLWIHVFYGVQDVRCYFFMFFCGAFTARLVVIFALLNSCSLWYMCGFYCKDMLLCVISLMSFIYVAEVCAVCFLFIVFTVIYNYALLFLLCFYFKCFCFNDVLFILFDYESCIIYCVLCLFMSFLLLFFMVDILYVFGVQTINGYMSYYLNFMVYFDISMCIVACIVLITILNVSTCLIMLFVVDCIMLFWRLAAVSILLVQCVFYSFFYFLSYSYLSVVTVWNVVIYFRYNFKYILLFLFLLYFIM